MKYLKYPLLILLVLILFYVALCYFGPKNLNVVETVDINAPSATIYNLANSLEATEKWNEWTMNDTSLVTNYNDIHSGVGASSSWTSDITGAGTQEIVESVQNKKVRSVMAFEGWDGKNYAEVNITPKGDKAQVSWAFEGAPLPFLMRGFALVTGMKDKIKTNYQKGLNNLKELGEERAGGTYDGYQIRENIEGEKHFVLNRQEVNMSNVQQFYTSNLGRLFSKVQAAGLEMKGMPCGLFFKAPDSRGMTDMAAAIPVSAAVSIEGAGSYTIDSRPAIILDFYGDYSATQLGHDAIDQYMNDRGYFQDPPMIEEYVTDPGEEADASKWLTKITYYFSSAE